MELLISSEHFLIKKAGKQHRLLIDRRTNKFQQTTEEVTTGNVVSKKDIVDIFGTIKYN